LRNLFEAKFSDALKAAGKRMEFESLYTNRTQFRDDIIGEIGTDLNGYKLEDVAIDYLEQTAREDHDPTNVLDAQGIEKINRITAKKEEETNKRTQEKDVNIKDDNVRAEMQKRDLDKQNAEDLARREREVKEAQAREGAAAEVEVQNNRKIAENSEIDAQKEIDLKAIDKDEEVKGKEFILEGALKRAEQAAKEEADISRVERERRVGLEEEKKNAEIIAAAFAVAESKAGLETKEKEVTEEHQKRLDVEADMTADRAKRVLMVEATAKAEASQKEATVAAEAEKDVRQHKAEAAQIEERTAALALREAADHEAERIQVTADAESKASEKRRHAMEQEAQGVAAQQAAPELAKARGVEAMAHAKKVDAEAEEAQGLAEATVIAKQGEASGIAKSAEGKGEGEAISARGSAEAAAIEALRLAEAEGTEKQGLADALAKTEMAKAIELFNKASQDHEEFRLQLDKDMAVDLAGINVQKDIADAQARVVGEALKSANIDIVGGENDFFEKVVRSVSQGKSVDRLVNNSQAITDVKNTFFNGDPDYFKTQLRTWISDLGITSEAVKNLTVSALLTKLVAQSDDSGTKSLIRQAQQMAKESGLMDTIVGDLLGKGAKG